MTQLKKPVPFFSQEEGSPPVPIASGEITSEMHDTLQQMRNFNGSREEAGEFLGKAVIALFSQALSDLAVKK
jgi:hypothetical protein